MKKLCVVLVLLAGSASTPTTSEWSCYVVDGIQACEGRPGSTVKPCLEDEPCWDCRVMGNKVCGPGVEP